MKDHSHLNLGLGLEPLLESGYVPPTEEFPGEAEELFEALVVLREWLADVEGSDSPLYQLVEQAVSTQDLGFMRVATEAWDRLPECERGKILRLSNLTIH